MRQTQTGSSPGSSSPSSPSGSGSSSGSGSGSNGGSGGSSSQMSQNLQPPSYLMNPSQFMMGGRYTLKLSSIVLVINEI